MQENFLELYEEVFYNDGQIKNCGREKCSKLILMADKIEPSVSHGDAGTGFVNIRAMKSLREEFVNDKD